MYLACTFTLFAVFLTVTIGKAAENDFSSKEVGFVALLKRGDKGDTPRLPNYPKTGTLPRQGKALFDSEYELSSHDQLKVESKRGPRPNYEKMGTLPKGNRINARRVIQASRKQRTQVLDLPYDTVCNYGKRNNRRCVHVPENIFEMDRVTEPPLLFNKLPFENPKR